MRTHLRPLPCKHLFRWREVLWKRWLYPHVLLHPVDQVSFRIFSFRYLSRSFPFLSVPFRSFPFVSCLLLSVSSRSFPFVHVLSNPFPLLPYPFLSFHILPVFSCSFPFLSVLCCPFQSLSVPYTIPFCSFVSLPVPTPCFRKYDKWKLQN